MVARRSDRTKNAGVRFCEDMVDPLDCGSRGIAGGCERLRPHACIWIHGPQPLIGFHRYQCVDVRVAVESREVVPDGFGCLKGREIIDEARVIEV